MNEEQKYLSEESLNLFAGKDKLERSESLSLPAAPPEGGTPPLDGLEGDEAWEDQRWRAQAPNDEATGLPDSPSWAEDAPRSPNLKARRRGTLARPVERPAMPLSPQQKLLLLDTWQRSGLPARDFGALVNISRQTLYAWKRRFQELGPAGRRCSLRRGRRAIPPRGGYASSVIGGIAVLESGRRREKNRTGLVRSRA